jgi:hypothetical protein
MRIRFAKNGVTHVPTSGGVQVVRGGETIDISEADWNALPADQRAVFEILFDPAENLPSGVELAYAEPGGNNTIVATVATALPTNPLSIGPIAPGIRPMYLHLHIARVFNDTAGRGVHAWIYDEAANVIDGSEHFSGAASEPGFIDVWARIPSGTPAHTYSVRSNVTGGGGTGTIVHSSAGVVRKTFLRAMSA